MADQYLETAAAMYGVPLWVLEGIADSEGATWDTVSGAGEVGRLQIHPVHAAEVQQKYGVTMQELANRPDIQVNYWVPKIADEWKKAKAQGKTDEQAAWDVVNNVMAPAQENRAREVANIMARQGGITTASQTTPPKPGVIDVTEEGWNPQGGAATEPTATDYQLVNPQEQFERQYPFTGQEQRLISDLTNMVDVGQLDEDQAWKILDQWRAKENITTERAETATTRGQEILRGTFPGTTFPGTGPGGIGDILAKKWGGPNLMPALQGIPTEQAMGVFGQAQQQVGLPAQLEPFQPPQFQLPNWGAFMQNMPTFGGGNKYLDELLKEGRSTAPTLG
jgi:hypothetical protein